jgi:hypothetical protein
MEPWKQRLPHVQEIEERISELEKARECSRSRWAFRTRSVKSREFGSNASKTHAPVASVVAAGFTLIEHLVGHRHHCHPRLRPAEQVPLRLCAAFSLSAFSVRHFNVRATTCGEIFLVRSLLLDPRISVFLRLRIVMPLSSAAVSGPSAWHEKSRLSNFFPAFRPHPPHCLERARVAGASLRPSPLPSFFLQ